MKQMNINEQKVMKMARWSLGGIENGIFDGIYEEGQFTVKELLDMAMEDVTCECPREVRFLGRQTIECICMAAVHEFLFEDGHKAADLDPANI